MPSLLLEIGTEELPAAACREAEAQLPELARAHIGTAPSQLFVGPRRLALLIDDLPERTADEWVKGPPENLRDQAAAGFAKKHDVAVDELELRDGFLGVTVPGRELREVLPEQIDRIVRGFSFTKSMRWDESGIRFARPVRWVLAKLDAETIVGETSFGHRFTHGAVEIPTATGYADALRAADVEPVAEVRCRLIVEGLDAIGGWSDPGGKLRSPSLPAPARSPRRPNGSRSWWSISGAATPRSRRRGWPRPTRPRSSSVSFPSSRATSAPSMRGSRATPRE